MASISKEQMAHDLAIAYTTYSASQEDDRINPAGFVEEYMYEYQEFLKIISSRS